MDEDMEVVELSSESESGEEGGGGGVGDGREMDRTTPLLTVFRMLIRNGGMDVISSGSGDESDEDSTSEYVLPGQRTKVEPPSFVYEPDLRAIQANDIWLTMSDSTTSKYPAPKSLSIPQLFKKRELGFSSSVYGAFDEQHRNVIGSHFLPNTLSIVSNGNYKAFTGNYSNDGEIFLSASQDRNIRIFDTSRGGFKEIRKISARDVGWSVLDTAFSPDGQYVAYSSWSESIHICRIRGESDQHDSLTLQPDSTRFCIFSIAFSDDGNEILGGANDGYLYIYDRTLNERVLKISAHEEDVNSVAFADESSQILFSGADDAILKVWDRRCLNENNPSPVGIFGGHVDGITYVSSKRDRRYLLTNSKDQSMKLWDMRSFTPQQDIQAFRTEIAKNRWDYRWQRVPKKFCKTSKPPLPSDRSVMTYRGHSVLKTLVRCRFSPPFSTGQKYVYTGCGAGRVVIYDLLTGEIVKVLSGHGGCVRDVHWHPYLNEIISTSWDGSLGRWYHESTHSIDESESEINEIEKIDEDEEERRRHLRRSSRLALKTQDRVRLRNTLHEDS